MAELGGSDQALLAMVTQLTREGWECHVALPGPSPMATRWSEAGARIHEVPMERITTRGGRWHWLRYALRAPGSILKLRRLARTLDVGVVHTNSLHCWYGAPAARLARRPHVWHAREIVVQSDLALRVERWMLDSWADEVIAVSQAVADQFPGVDPAHRSVLYDQVDPGRFSPAMAGRFRPTHDIDDRTYLVGSVGRIDTWKGIEVLLDAWPEVAAAVPDAMAVIAGPAVAGKEAWYDELRQRAEALGSVRWIGPSDDVGALMADLDVFVLPSKEPEPYGMVVVEALASGVPVIATDAGGPKEILGQVDRSLGTLVPPGDPSALARAIIARHAPSARELRRQRTAQQPGGRPDYGAVFDRAMGHDDASR
jgi:glycosyltransferase involved in cell wall biosynthesis